MNSSSMHFFGLVFINIPHLTVVSFTGVQGKTELYDLFSGEEEAYKGQLM